MAFEQPARPEGAPEFDDGNDLFAHELSLSIDEVFFGYNNRHSDDNRSAQVHLGPSEIGTPCDRRIAMALMGRPHVNPGGDGFAAWLGTQGHRGMAEIYEWADGRSGRFAVETPLSFESKLVPKGTGDLLDRKLRCFVDWKFMGYWSLKHLREKGPSDTYRVQIHTYAYGAVKRGEKVDRVAIVGMPRQGQSLKEKYVWSEPYDPSIAEAALERVAKINDRIRADAADAIAFADSLKALDIAKDCDYCDFYLPKSSDLAIACNGKV